MPCLSLPTRRVHIWWEGWGGKQTAHLEIHMHRISSVCAWGGRYLRKCTPSQPRPRDRPGARGAHEPRSARPAGGRRVAESGQRGGVWLFQTREPPARSVPPPQPSGKECGWNCESRPLHEVIPLRQSAPACLASLSGPANRPQTAWASPRSLQGEWRWVTPGRLP